MYLGWQRICIVPYPSCQLHSELGDVQDLEKFAKEKTLGMLVKELGSLKMELKGRVKDFNQRFNRILKKLTVETKSRDSVIVEYYTSTLPTSTVQFIKQTAKPTLLENFQEEIDVEKDLHVIGVIIHDEPTKDSKDMGRRSHNVVSKVKEKEASEIETLTCLLNSLTTKEAKLKKCMTEIVMRRRPPKFAKRKNVTLGRSSSHLTKST